MPKNAGQVQLRAHAPRAAFSSQAAGIGSMNHGWIKFALIAKLKKPAGVRVAVIYGALQRKEADRPAAGGSPRDPTGNCARRGCRQRSRIWCGVRRPRPAGRLVTLEVATQRATRPTANESATSLVRVARWQGVEEAGDVGDIRPGQAYLL